MAPLNKAIFGAPYAVSESVPLFGGCGVYISGKQNFIADLIMAEVVVGTMHLADGMLCAPVIRLCKCRKQIDSIGCVCST